MLVKRQRARMGLTQEQFAQAVVVTYITINQWGTAVADPQAVSLKPAPRDRAVSPRRVEERTMRARPVAMLVKGLGV